ncbi:MAG: BlaI/MecI/CopY family transcriptional regulator [Thermoproteota archaeon]
MVHTNDKKRLEIRFADGLDFLLSLRLEGESVEKYKATILNLIPIILSRDVESPIFSKISLFKAEKSQGNSVLEVLRRQSIVLSDILKVIREFGGMDFSSKDVKRKYEERLGRPIRLSTVATYLMRLHDKGLLARKRQGREYVYQAQTILLQNK